MTDWGLQQALKKHKEFWLTISELCLDKDAADKYCGADMIKATAIEKMGYQEDELNFDCFCCDFTGYTKKDARARDFSKCANCPIDWGIDMDLINEEAPPCCLSLFDEFDDAIIREDFKEAHNLAFDIANLPVNPIYLEYLEEE